MKSSSILVATVALGASLVSGVRTLKGCYEVSDGTKLLEDIEFNSVGICGDKCTKQMSATFALAGRNCFCGDMFANDANKVADDKCSRTCNGWPTDLCASQFPPSTASQVC